MDTIYFSIPDFWNLYHLNMILLQWMRDEPEKFYNDVKVGSIYGSFPCIWNSGREIYGRVDRTNIIQTTENINSLNIQMRNTFTNVLLQDNHLYDTLGNMILQSEAKIAKKYGVKNACTVNLPLMENYIKNNYPMYDIIYSTTKEITDLEIINKLSENNLLVLSYRFNNNFEFLKRLKHPENIEILNVEEGCVPNCPYRNQHQINTAKFNLLEHFNTTRPAGCKSIKPNRFASYYYNDYSTQEYYISIDDIREKYLPLGFNKFKISGRNGVISSKINTIEAYINMFVKPEYKDEMRIKLVIDEIGDRPLTLFTKEENMKNGY